MIKDSDPVYINILKRESSQKQLGDEIEFCCFLLDDDFLNSWNKLMSKTKKSAGMA